MDQLEYVESVFEICWEYDFDEVLWRRIDGPWRAYVICNDWFELATADAEVIQPEDVNLLSRCARDLREIELRAEDADDHVATVYIGCLFAARKRGQSGILHSGLLGALTLQLFSEVNDRTPNNDAD